MTDQSVRGSATLLDAISVSTSGCAGHAGGGPVAV